MGTVERLWSITIGDKCVAPEAAFPAGTLELLTKSGQRIQEEFKVDDNKKTWYGGIVGDSGAYGGEKVPYGLDDGELCLQSLTEIAKLAELGSIKTCDIECGLHADRNVTTKAVGLSYMKCGNVWAPVGVLLNDEQVTPLTAHPVYSAHIVSITSVEAAQAYPSSRPPERVTRAKDRGTGDQSKRREGFHTFQTRRSGHL